MTGGAIPATGRRAIHPAWEFISLRTQPAPLRCALTLRVGHSAPGQSVIFIATRYQVCVLVQRIGEESDVDP
jgi:hypothetical protein